ncbi:MAG: high-potential iron-sulfur protein [Gammaproteobacteria bacterium]
MQDKTRTNTVAATLASRRDALKKTAALGAGVVLGAGLITHRRAAAADLPQLAEDNPQAMALGYRHDAATVDITKYPMADPATKNCANCQLFQARAASAWGGCPLFAGKAVNAQGWCTAWAKRVG